MKGKAKISVALIDDHVLVRKGLNELITMFRGVEVCIEASNGTDFLSQMEQGGPMPDLCIMDINMPGKNGYETIAEARKRWPQMKFLVLTMYDNEDAMTRMFRNGANGYLLKSCGAAEIKKAIEAITKYGYYYTEQSEECINMIMTASDKHQARISEREFQFLTMCCEDFTYKEIADRMELSLRTVEGYRDHLFSKLNVKTRTGLVIHAITMGLRPNA